MTGAHSKPPRCDGSGREVEPYAVQVSLTDGRQAECTLCGKSLWLNRAPSPRGEGAYDHFYPEHIG